MCPDYAPEHLEDRMAQERTVGRLELEQSQDRAWFWFLLACLALMGLELKTYWFSDAFFWCVERVEAWL